MKADGAAIGFFGATGLVKESATYMMSEGFYNSVLDPANSNLGDMIVSGKQYYSDQNDGQNDNRYLLDIYNLLGDPATSVHR